MHKKSHNNYISNTSTCLDVNVFGVMTIYVIVFVICSILSLAYVGFFYPVCLLYIIVNNDILQRVLRAVTKNGKIKTCLWFHVNSIKLIIIHNRYFLDPCGHSGSGSFIHICSWLVCFLASILCFNKQCWALLWNIGGMYVYHSEIWTTG